LFPYGKYTPTINGQKKYVYNEIMTLFERFKLHFSHNRPPAHVHFNALTMLDYNYIDEGVYIGTNQCCTAGLTDVLQKEGIQTDISLEKDRIDQPYGVSQYLWIPTLDHGVPEQGQLDFGIHALQYLIAQGQKIYIHCRNGHGRSSTFYSAYLVKTRGYTQEDALLFIQKHRPTAHMQDEQKVFIQNYYKKLYPEKTSL
jgi:protein tyrosine phosphatase